MAGKVKITVIKQLSTSDVYGTDLPCQVADDLESVCPALEVGSEFVADGGTCPPGFCGWAFADIQRDIAHLWLGGEFPWIKDKGVAISCCTDGLRPVFFKLERTE